MRTVADEDDEDDAGEEEDAFARGRNGNGQYDEDNDHEGVHAVKAVVGPDELLPGEVEDPPKNGEKMVGFTQALMWLPAIFDVSGACLTLFIFRGVSKYESNIR